MIEPESLRFLLLIGQWVVVPAVGWIAVSVRGIYRELRTQNSRLTKMEERLHGHMTLDESRFDDLHASVKEILLSLRELRTP